jgi:hypothetical protein
MNEGLYRKYFEERARLHKEIKHTTSDPCFFADAKKATTRTLKKRSMILFPQLLRVDDEKSDNVFKYKEGAFWIIEPCDRDNEEQQLTAQETAEKIGWEFIVRIDAESRGFVSERKTVDFDFNSVRGFPLAEELNNCWGYGYTFETGDPDLADPDNEEDEDEDKVWLDTP